MFSSLYIVLIYLLIYLFIYLFSSIQPQMWHWTFHLQVTYDSTSIGCCIYWSTNEVYL